MNKNIGRVNTKMKIIMYKHFIHTLLMRYVLLSKKLSVIDILNNTLIEICRIYSSKINSIMSYYKFLLTLSTQTFFNVNLN